MVAGQNMMTRAAIIFIKMLNLSHGLSPARAVIKVASGATLKHAVSIIFA